MTSKYIVPTFGEVPILLVPVQEGLLHEMQGIVKFFFPAPTAHYANMDTEEYRNIVVLAQMQMEERNIHHKFTKSRYDMWPTLFPGLRNVGVQRPRLRAVRPSMDGVQESIGWHRENLYGNMGMINIWIPIFNVCVDTAMQYIPDSHKIKNEDIQTSDVIDESCHRDSAGHQLGLLDVEKRIIGGVDLSTKTPLVVLPGEAAVFDGALIHGVGKNHSDQIRFSVDWRVLGDAGEA